ncbi:alpha-ketoglutarate-dependent dioxygenase alkB homolog 6 [Toxorhynchites rutilus septentrionalis]|uniref:alpha-ketoglutarate-dependent dioxygenase alkB homolog 6 n=1 Tax=Toxorhynchites rutilus septentrionalis TaxID=329112 RepID=UPI00247A7AC2|nr:alpha-ketoglutarate-dependent dioxygenase alkB homolog 6 [Toxorhynchites rutilus septentrionalis]
MDWKRFFIDRCPPSAYYIPNFLTLQEEKLILSMIVKTPKPRWTQLSNRRLINYGGVPHPKGMITEEIPTWLQSIVGKVNQLNEVFDGEREANHVLVNEYLAGQGIMPHSDGPLFHPTITTVSCGSHAVLEFHEPYNDGEVNCPQKRQPVAKLLVQPRSLLVLKDDLYHKYLHSIAEFTEDTIDESIANLTSEDVNVRLGDIMERGTRISLTIRHVPKTSKVKIKLR